MKPPEEVVFYFTALLFILVSIFELRSNNNQAILNYFRINYYYKSSFK